MGSKGIYTVKIRGSERAEWVAYGNFDSNVEALNVLLNKLSNFQGSIWLGGFKVYTTKGAK